MKQKLFFLILLSFKSCFILSQVFTEEENKLYKLLMEYRSEKGLTAIPISKSLTIVAQTHAKDLQENTTRQGNCNLHSWSNKGKWSSCCYTPIAYCNCCQVINFGF